MNYGFAFFPGQGAQAPGMGKDLYENSQAAKLVFEEASEGAGLDVAKLCFESDKETLSRTENSQIAIFTHSMAAWAALKEAGVEFKAEFLIAVIVIVWLVINELISILENVAALGGPVPEFLRKLIRRLKVNIEQKTAQLEDGDDNA